MNEDLKIRLGGLGLTAIGAGLGWWLILGPYRQALAGAPEVEYSLKAFFVVPLCLIFGLAFLLGGTKLPYRNAEKKTLTTVGWVLFGVIAVLAGLCFWWLKTQFAALGYA